VNVKLVPVCVIGWQCPRLPCGRSNRERRGSSCSLRLRFLSLHSTQPPLQSLTIFLPPPHSLFDHKYSVCLTAGLFTMACKYHLSFSLTITVQDSLKAVAHLPARTSIIPRLISRKKPTRIARRTSVLSGFELS
jgi:hypothetical protein